MGTVLRAAAEWLQGYALDFLLRARDQQMAVPAASLQRGLTWLNRTVDKLSPNAQAYAWYVLAKAGLADPGRVRYFQDTKGADDHGRPCLGAARRGAEPGRRARPRPARLRASPASTSTSATPATITARRCATAPRCWRWRPEAGGREGARRGRRLRCASAWSPGSTDTTTQEQAWLVLAARAMSGGGELAYSVDGQPRKSATEPVVINPDQAAIARGMRVTQRRRAPGLAAGDGARRADAIRSPPPPKGLSVAAPVPDARRASPPTSRRLRQNDRLIVSIDGRNLDGGYHEVALLDLLPAGFEIESVLNEETVKSFPFLSKLTETRIAEARDDRFFASFNLGRRSPTARWWDDATNSFTQLPSTSPTSCAP